MAGIDLPNAFPNSRMARAVRLGQSRFVSADAAVTRYGYSLMSGASGTSFPLSGIQGGDYIWSVEGTFAGATATLQYLNIDGVTWSNAKKADGVTDVTLSASGVVGVGIGQNATLRVLITGGPPSGLNSTLSGV